MRTKSVLMIGMLAVASACATPAESPEAAAKYGVKVPNGLAFSEFKGYEDWHLISISQDGPAIAAIMGNPVMIKAYESGIPGNGKPFPDGSKMTKIHWVPTKMATFPAATVPGRQHDVDFMVKDSKRFKDSGGWAGPPSSTTRRVMLTRPPPPPTSRRRATTPSAGSAVTPS